MSLQIFWQNCTIIALGRKKVSCSLLLFVHHVEWNHKYASEIHAVE